MTAYTVRDLPPGLWTYFKSRIQGDYRYTSLNSRLIDLIAIDQAIFEETNKDCYIFFVDHGELTDNDIDYQYNRDPPANIESNDVADAYTLDNVPEGLWTYFKNRSQGDPSIHSISESIVRLIAIDQTIADQSDAAPPENGLLTWVLSKEITEENDITDALQKEPPDQRPYK